MGNHTHVSFLPPAGTAGGIPCAVISRPFVGGPAPKPDFVAVWDEAMDFDVVRRHVVAKVTTDFGVVMSCSVVDGELVCLVPNVRPSGYRRLWYPPKRKSGIRVKSAFPRKII